jgi:hypothetical protein
MVLDVAVAARVSAVMANKPEIRAVSNVVRRGNYHRGAAPVSNLSELGNGLARMVDEVHHASHRLGVDGHAHRVRGCGKALTGERGGSGAK